MSSVIEKLLDEKLARILKFFVNNEGKEFYLHEIARATQVPVATCYRILNRLVKFNIIQSKKVKKIVLYSLARTPETNELKKLFKREEEPLSYFVEKVKGMGIIEDIILHGGVKNSKANIIILGKIYDSQALESLVKEIEASYGLKILPLTLTKSQFQSMLEMGLFPNKRTSLL